MNREGKKCILYPRVSTEMQVEGYSLDGQKTSLKKFAEREEMQIVGIYEDAGKSGKSIEGRPAFKRMLSDIQEGLDVDYVLVYKLSRFGRNAADILNSLEFIQSYGVNLICIEEGIDSSQTSGKLLTAVFFALFKSLPYKIACCHRYCKRNVRKIRRSGQRKRTGGRATHDAYFFVSVVFEPLYSFFDPFERIIMVAVIFLSRRHRKHVYAFLHKPFYA